MTRDFLDISNAAQDVANIAREAYAVAMVLGHSGDLRLTKTLEAKREAIFEEFLQLADAIGCDVVKREDPTLLAAE